MLVCKFCSQEKQSVQSLVNHERLCKQNPNRQSTPFQDPEFQRTKGGAQSNQYIKATQLGLPKPECSKATRDARSAANLARTKEWHIENGKRISKTIREKVAKGEWHTSLAKHMHIEYRGVDLHGTWELKYAQYLDDNNISWMRNIETFEYYFEGTLRRYTPDFYLPSIDEYVEIKGFSVEKDLAKWSQFPSDKKLKILMRKDLEDLGILL